MILRILVLIALLILTGLSAKVLGQGATRQTYHDAQRTHLKEVYQVKDTIRNLPHGLYVSYYLSGQVESRGQFTNNETSGVWDFYYETGKLKMRGILFKGANYGMWEYFFESGQKSMEGIINGKNREGEWRMYYENGKLKEEGEYKNNKHVGEWKSYFEDGVLKGSVEYEDDYGRYTEHYHSGKVRGEGPKAGSRSVGHWRYFGEDGTLESEGEYVQGLKSGSWTNYYPSGKPSSKGEYSYDRPTGTWQYFFEDGTTSATGQFEKGMKDGEWKTFNSNGSLKSVASYLDGAGDYREFYDNGNLKLTGRIVDDKREGTWQFFYADGKKEGICEYIKGRGTYQGFYPGGALQSKGPMEGDLKTGTWEIYEQDGSLSGYYRPFYDNQQLSSEITSLASKTPSRTTSTAKRGFSYFDARFHEFQGVIFGTNPVWLAAGKLPLGIEFYLQERMGHEFEFIGIRDPFFKGDLNVPPGKLFDRGYSIAIKQKFYNPMKAGLWYFGHEIRFTNLGHFVNQKLLWAPAPDNIFTFNAVEQRIEWGVLVGYRIMRRNNGKGFTMDAFISGDLGYRASDVDTDYSSYFEDINQDKFSRTFHFGLNLGNVFSFR